MVAIKGHTYRIAVKKKKVAWGLSTVKSHQVSRCKIRHQGLEGLQAWPETAHDICWKGNWEGHIRYGQL
jgi:hypothetical protein